jgi:hypothetical protein
MMSIADQFGRKRNIPKIDPEISMPRVVVTEAPNDKHARSLSYVNDLVEDNQRLTTENERLRSDLRLAVMRIRDLERLDTARAQDLEAYRRYSVEVQTHFQYIKDAIMRAEQAALEAGEGQIPTPDDRVAQAVKAIESELEGAEAAPKTDEAANQSGG